MRLVACAEDKIKVSTTASSFLRRHILHDGPMSDGCSFICHECLGAFGTKVIGVCVCKVERRRFNTARKSKCFRR
jgi:hypothetical protein